MGQRLTTPSEEPHLKKINSCNTRCKKENRELVRTSFCPGGAVKVPLCVRSFSACCEVVGCPGASKKTDFCTVRRVLFSLGQKFHSQIWIQTISIHHYSPNLWVLQPPAFLKWRSPRRRRALLPFLLLSTLAIMFLLLKCPQDSLIRSQIYCSWELTVR